MNIHTLGPHESDSFCTLKKILHENIEKKALIKLHKSYEEIILNLKKYKGDFFFLPVAFKFKNEPYGWGEFNFEHQNNVKLKEIYYESTMPMYLVENLDYKLNKAIIHPATEIYIRNYCKNSNSMIEIDYESSKVLAYEKMKSDNYRLCIISKQVYENDQENKSCKIRKTFKPKMLWCMYEIL